MPKRKPRCNWPLCCCSHHLQPKQPNTCVERERVDVSLRGGREASSRSHRCSPEAYPRCVAAGRHSATDTLSTLSAWRAIRQRFASRCRRMYLFLQYASSVSHRSLTATRTRTVTMSWYGWHGRAVAEPAGKGTRADERLAHEMARNKFRSDPLHWASQESSTPFPMQQAWHYSADTGRERAESGRRVKVR